jgi:hypothetical protein
MFTIDEIKRDVGAKEFVFKLIDGTRVTLRYDIREQSVVMPENKRYYKLDVLMAMLDFIKKNI